MLDIGSSFFLQIPSKSKQRRLHPVEVVGCSADTYTAKFEEDNIPLEADQDVLIYFEEKREFMQQAAHVSTSMHDETKLIIEFQTTGDPVSAESRQCYRVSTVMADLAADFGSEKNCPLLDVSCTGLAVIAAEAHDIGSLADIKLTYENREYAGKSVVQSERELSKGRIRYGLLCVKEKQATTNLMRGLEYMTVALQREQLRRLAVTG
ncbi:MAG: hypothetical protein MI923_16360 [Phycisphaerales bacterium]|nr:hypothetical protein [Phycisphaerales bacterium]